MKRLEEIKNELSQKLGYQSISDLRLDYATYGGRMEIFIDKVSELYAKECVKASLEKASEKATVFEVDWDTNIVDKESITDAENIVLL